MDWLIPLAAKSFLIAGGALLLLRLLANRSAADRSWIAHLSLAGLLLLPVATFALPTLDVAGPELLVGKAEVQSPSSVLAGSGPAAVTGHADQTVPAAASAGVGGAAVDWPFWGYAVPAALLFLLTLIAVVRLFVLKARATVMVDAPWLTALARAQQRMGFKHGTALLTSNELPSPISWGVVRPVILLNADAARSHDEAEAIITHELAHVARLDWAKLLLARVAVAIFWFNPFVWLLAREAHQLREEAADDAVLATDIEETDYARLLVGVARHECRGLLIGAHGVAPGRHSLARRVRRVLDRAARRAPGGWRWGSAAAFFAAGMSVPVAALNLVPASAPHGDAIAPESPYYASADPVAADSADLAGAPPATAPDPVDLPNAASASGMAIGSDKHGRTVLRLPDGRSIISGPDGRTLLRSSDGRTVALADARTATALATAVAGHPDGRVNSAVDRAVAMKAVGATPEYVASIRAAAPYLRLRDDDFVPLKAVGVTPAFLRELGRLGYRDVDAGDIAGAYAVGVREHYVREIASAGYGRLPLEKLTALKAVGVTAADIARFRRAGYSDIDVDRLVKLKALGISPEELKASEDMGP